MLVIGRLGCVGSTGGEVGGGVVSSTGGGEVAGGWVGEGALEAG